MDFGPTDIVKGIKTFFIAPDVTILPENHLKNFFMRGYETYFLKADSEITLEQRIHALFSIFPEVILFFNIDYEIEGLDWAIFIDELQTKYTSRAMIGVFYSKENNPVEIKNLERMYLYNIGIMCGCIHIESKKEKNLYLFLNVLTANQANGQRKFIRATCDERCSITLSFGGIPFSASVRDISLYCFSCVFSEDMLDIPLLTKCTNIKLQLADFVCTLDGVFALKRVVDNVTVYVCIFRNPEEQDVIPVEYLLQINNYIYQTLSSSIKKMISLE